MKKLIEKIVYVDCIESTQKEMWKLLENENFVNQVLITKKQTAGIGTHGRKWYCDDNNIIFTIGIKLRNDVNINKFEGLTIDIAKIIIQVFKELYNIEKITIKNPNDLMINSKKVGGILTETKLLGNTVNSLCLGVGINTNQNDFEKFDEIKDLATSIKKEFDINIENDKCIKLFLKYFEENLNKRIGEI